MTLKTSAPRMPNAVVRTASSSAITAAGAARLVSSTLASPDTSAVYATNRRDPTMAAKTTISASTTSSAPETTRAR
jgi:hypothetical protein